MAENAFDQLEILSTFFFFSHWLVSITYFDSLYIWNSGHVKGLVVADSIRKSARNVSAEFNIYFVRGRANARACRRTSGRDEMDPILRLASDDFGLLQHWAWKKERNWKVWRKNVIGQAEQCAPARSGSSGFLFSFFFYFNISVFLSSADPKGKAGLSSWLLLLFFPSSSFLMDLSLYYILCRKDSALPPGRAVVVAALQ